MRRDAAFGFRGPSRRRDGGSEAAVGSPMPTGIGPSTQIYPIAPRAGTGELSGCRSRCLLRALRQVVLGPRARAPIVPMVTAGSSHVVVHAALLAAPVSATWLPLPLVPRKSWPWGSRMHVPSFGMDVRARAWSCRSRAPLSPFDRFAAESHHRRDARGERRAVRTPPPRRGRHSHVCVRCQHR